MNEQRNVDVIFNKLQEIKGFLMMGGEVVPFLTDLYNFIRDIIPLMAEFNVSLRDSTNRLPDAANKMIDVTEVTEMATHDILDKLEYVLKKMNDVVQIVDDNEKTLIKELQNNITEIIYALQFQDIIAQELEHANRILNAVYERFLELLKSLESLESNSDIGRRWAKDAKGKVNQKIRDTDRHASEEKTKDFVRSNGISQEDIDRLFK